MDTQLKTFIKVEQGDFVVPIKEACEREGGYSEAYPIGFPIFDRAMKVKDQPRGGVRDGDLVILTGLSGRGKTTYAMNITKNFLDEGIFSLWFSYEVIVDNLYAKFKEMGIETEDDLIYTPKKNISGATNWIGKKIKEAKEKYCVKMIFIDHLDFLSSLNNNKSDQRRIMLGDICQELRTIAINQKVIIFLIAHVRKIANREVEMQDISESSKIYQLADYVFSVDRNFDIEVDNHKRVITNNNRGIVKILKNRLTGEFPFMNFRLVNNIIKPI